MAPADDATRAQVHSPAVAELAQQLSAKPNASFDRAIANRLWALLMGRGLVDPVDLHHDSNPPAHPAVLALMAESFRAMKYDLPRDARRTRAAAARTPARLTWLRSCRPAARSSNRNWRRGKQKRLV